MRLCATVVLGLGLPALSFSADGFEEFSLKTQKSVKDGRVWLLKAQNKDGSWGMDHKTPTDVSASCLAGLALLSSGDNERDGCDAETIQALQKCVSFLVQRAKKARPGRDIAEGETGEFQQYVGQNVATYFATLFLSQIYGMRAANAVLSEDAYADMKEALQKLTDTIAACQDSDGSWHKNTYASLQSTTMAWMALRSANSTGLKIRHATVDKTLKFVRKQFDPTQRLYQARRGDGGGNVIYDTASCLRILYGSGLRGEKEVVAAMDTLLDKLTKNEWGHGFLTNTGEDYPAAFFISHALVQEGGARWQKWHRFATDRFLKLQNKDGSWTATSCLRGRTVPTACALLCLQTPLRVLPVQDL